MFERRVRLDDSAVVPLLDHPDSETYATSTTTSPTQPWHKPKRIVHIFMLVVLLISLGDQLFQSPQTRIMESVICYRYYERADPSKILLGRSQVGPGAIGGVAELDCKTGAVQSELVTVRGWQIFLDCIPSLLLAIPFGWGADKYGRRPFVFAGLTAVVLRSTWIQVV